MISQKQLQQWRLQSLKDIQQYRKDEQYLRKINQKQKSSLSGIVQNIKTKYFNILGDQNFKLNRLLEYTQMRSQLTNYPEISKTYLTYNTVSLIVFATCVLAPKKIISKIIISLITYGVKIKIFDGMLTYYMLENMALSKKMTQKQQELRNVLEFYYMHKFYTKSIISQDEKNRASQLIKNIQKVNQTYKKFKQVEKLI